MQHAFENKLVIKNTIPHVPRKQLTYNIFQPTPQQITTYTLTLPSIPKHRTINNELATRKTTQQ